jgi:urease accessory protein
MSRLAVRSGAATALLVAHAAPAQAHIVASRLGDFYAGAVHPLTDLQDLLLWAALGLLGGSLGAARGRWLVVLLPLGLVAGISVGAWLGTAAAGAVVSPALMVVIGLLLAARLRLPATALWVLGFGLALVRGFVNAGGIAPETDRVLFAAGLGTAGYAVITLVMALTLAFLGSGAGPAASWRGIAVRVCGSWIAAIGLMIGGFALVS